MGKKDPNIILIQGCPNWMLTMGDCMSLLVTFFVMMMAFSTPNSGQLMDAMEGIQGALGIMPQGNVLDAQQRQGQSNAPAQDEDRQFEGNKPGGHSASTVKEDELAVVNLKTLNVSNRFNQFKERLMEIGFAKLVNGEQLNRGIVITIPVDTMFKPGGKEFIPKTMQILEAFSNLAWTVGNEIQIVARFSVDDNSTDPTNWTMAREQIFAISHELQTRHRIHDSRFTYGYEIIDASQKASICLTLCEKIGVSQISIQDLIKSSKEL